MRKLRTRLQKLLTDLRRAYLRGVWGMDIGEGARVSGKAFLDFTNPRGMHIGANTIVTPGARIFSHNFVEGRHVDTYIGHSCFIGANSLIMPGVRVGDHCVVGAGAVVTKDVPSHSLVAGNPARVLRSQINTGYWGMMRPDAQGYIKRFEEQESHG